MTPKIAVLDNLNLLGESQQQLQNLAGVLLKFPKESITTQGKLVERTGDAEIILVSPRAKITKHFFDSCPSVKYIGVCGTSIENVDREEVAKQGIVLTNVSDYGDEPAAEFIFMQLITLLRGTGKYQWKDVPHELMGRSIGIIGLGALGKAIVHLALAFKMRTQYYSLHKKPEWETRGAKFNNLQDLLGSSEIICISVPTNTKILSGKDFKHIKPGSIVVQASMGDVFEEKDFLDWIKEDGNYAIFDYSAGEEKYESRHTLPRVIFPKVVAGHSIETRQRLGQKVIENLKNYLEQFSSR